MQANQIIKNISKENARIDTSILANQSLEKAKRLFSDDIDNINDFPIESFPLEIRDWIENFHKKYGFSKDYYALGAMIAFSTIAGNNFQAEYEPGWAETAMLYGIIVGRSGIGKTRVMKHAMNPVYEIISDNYNKYIAEYSRKEQELLDTGQPLDESKLPKMKRIKVGDINLEALIDILMQNPNGVILERGELLGWIKSMNQYRAGGDKEFWLEAYDNADFPVDRKNVTKMLFRLYVTVFGGVQEKKLQDLAKGGDGNGFLQRLLFAYPNSMQKPKQNKLPVPIVSKNKYKEMIDRMYSMPKNYGLVDDFDGFVNRESIIIKLDQDAQNEYYKYLDRNCDISNASDDEVIKEIYSKMDTYCLRFCLIIKLMNLCVSNHAWTVEELQAQTISVSIVKKAIKIVDYFVTTSKKVHNKMASIVDRLPKEHRVWYESLPGEFTTKFADEHARALNLVPRTMKRKYLNIGDEGKKYFKKIGSGLWVKIYDY